MMRMFVLALALAACSGSHEESGAPHAAATRVKAAVTPDSVAYFAGGCFWGVEYYLEQMDGVATVEDGYMGGTVDHPTYEQVSAHETGHLESVRVRYDSKQVSYEQIARRFFEIHDPTQADGQGPDIGPQYHSAVFYTTPAEKAIAEKLIGLLRKRGYDVVTQVRPATRFWRAEEYHQDHYQRSGEKPYCHVRVRRFDRDAH